MNPDSFFKSRFLVAFFFALCASQTHATLLTFDELVDPPHTGDNYEPLFVYDQYQALGVIFNGAGLYNYEFSPQIVSRPNALMDSYGPGMWIYFSGNLPTHVSMYVSSGMTDSISVVAFGTNGQPISSVDTDGWRGDEDISTPYRDQQIVAFAGLPISRIELMGSSARRGGVIIDNLEFTSDVSVPIPSGFILLGSGLGGLMMLRRTRRPK